MAKRLSSEDYAKRAFMITALMAFAYIAAAYFGVINAPVEDVGTDKGFPSEGSQHD
jgi:hypothetical protein